MKKINLIDDVVDLIELNVDLPASNTDPFVVPDDVVVYGGYLSNGNGTYTAPDTPPPSVDNVITERRRRFDLGFDYDFGDSRGVHHIGTTVEDMIGWDEVTKATQAFIALGVPTTTITVKTDTGPATLTALEWQQILAYSTQVRQPIWTGSFVLQATSPIPTDYTDDSHWT